MSICRTARDINFTDVLYLHCCLHVHQEQLSICPTAIYTNFTDPRCCPHVHQEPCAYLSDSKVIYLQMCYILAVSCWPGAACLSVQQQEPMLVRAAQVQEGAELSALRLHGRRGQMRHHRPVQVNHVFLLVRSYHAQATQHIIMHTLGQVLTTCQGTHTPGSSHMQTMF